MRPLRPLLVAFIAWSLAAAPAAAHDIDDIGPKSVDTHGVAAEATGTASSLVADNFDLVGRSKLGGGVPNGDVWLYDHGGSVGKHAYVGTWSAQCTGQGAKVVDVSEPDSPRWIGFVGARRGSSNEDVVVRRIGDRDVLGIGVQACGRGGSDGLALYDVTNPNRPVELGFLATPTGVHELDLVVRTDGTALALMATPYSEFSDTYFETDFGGEFRIADISDPTAPAALADWGIIADSDLEIQVGNDETSSSFQGPPGFFAANYAHSVRAADDGMTAYVSYWDGGILKFDISDPAAPLLIGRTMYAPGDSGDGHSMTPYDVGDTRYILQNDEDFDPVPTLVVTSSAGSALGDGIQMPWAPIRLTAGDQAVTGEVVDAGDGCEASDYVGAAGKIALADAIDPFYVDVISGWPEPPCSIGAQTLLASAAGADAVLFNLISPDDAYAFAPGADEGDLAGVGPMGVFMIADIDDVASEIRSALGGGDVTVTVDAGDPSYGYVRVYRETAGDEWSEVARFADAPHAYGEFPAPGGTWSVHNTEVFGDRAYSAWYSNGIIAIDMSDPLNPVRVGQFVPTTNQRHANSLGVGPAEVWGVAIDPDTGFVYLSEMRTGLWIVDPTGPAEPS